VGWGANQASGVPLSYIIMMIFKSWFLSTGNPLYHALVPNKPRPWCLPATTYLYYSPLHTTMAPGGGSQMLHRLSHTPCALAPFILFNPWLSYVTVWDVGGRLMPCGLREWRRSTDPTLEMVQDTSVSVRPRHNAAWKYELNIVCSAYENTTRPWKRRVNADVALKP